MKKLVLIILFLAILLASALFFSQNDSLVTVDYILSEYTLPLNWLMIGLFVLGFTVGYLVIFVNLMNSKLRLAKSNRQVNLKDKEIKNLRNLPLKEDY